jgi:hypothetical protein
MANYIVHISDAGRSDCQVSAEVNERTTLAQAVQEALEDYMAQHAADVEFPIFLDIHPAEEFANRAWMHPLASE